MKGPYSSYELVEYDRFHATEDKEKGSRRDHHHEPTQTVKQFIFLSVLVYLRYKSLSYFMRFITAFLPVSLQHPLCQPPPLHGLFRSRFCCCHTFRYTIFHMSCRHPSLKHHPEGIEGSWSFCHTICMHMCGGHRALRRRAIYPQLVYYCLVK